jgi:glutathione S-transferase
MEYATLMVMLTLLQYSYFVGRAGHMRAKHGIKAPATTGHEMYERAYRVQQNTLEELIIFVPAVFTYALYSNAFWVIVPGAIFFIGRGWYSMAYMKNPVKRGPGFGLTLLANVWLIVGTLIGLGRVLL